VGRHSVLAIVIICLASAARAEADFTTTVPTPAPTAAASSAELEEIVVTATLRRLPVEQVPGSVTVLDGATLRAAGHENFEDVMALVPNLNWAGDTSLPRYFQIRGIGELQQYQGAPNPSVGFLIDDIDFSGLGMAATLFDVDHIEVLRGPQGTIYGANALAGLIVVRTAAPADTFGGRVELEAGNYGERSAGAVLTGPVAALDSSFRLAVEQVSSDGFYRNLYLNRDTDNRNELTVRGKWHFQPHEDLSVDLEALRIQIDNGYDAWSIFNDSRTVYSDQPGVDRQYSTAFALHLLDRALGFATLTGIATYADHDVTWSYDGDWGNPALWAPYTDQYFEVQQRHRTTRTLELRLDHDGGAGLSWIAGLYGLGLREGLIDTSTGLYLDPAAPANDVALDMLTQSRYQAWNGAVYGQLDGALGARGRWSVGVRGERRTTHYDDAITNLDAAELFHHFDPENNLWGGELSLSERVAPGQEVYALLARGYKAGGFNLSPGLPADQLLFSPEWTLNYEVGHKALVMSRRLQIDTSLFYMERHGEQLLTGEQLEADNPDSFVYYTGNARSGYNYGLESDWQWKASATLTLGGSLGLLQTLYRGFVQNEELLPSRGLPHAPPWQAALNASWNDPRGPFARLDLTGMGAFFYDMPPNWTRSRPYGLLNLRLGWHTERWEVSLWGRNLLDKDYTVRGFYFGDIPPNFPNQLFTQLGDPRNVGVHLVVHY